MEWKLFDGETPYVSTFDYHKDRPRAPHAEQSDHRPRLDLALDFVVRCRPEAVADLGCGDGGLVSMLVKALPDTVIEGYDFTPSTREGWLERGVAGLCQHVNVFPEPPGPVIDPDIEATLEYISVVVMTEILEHLARPHEVLSKINSEYLVASSPWNETPNSHCESHAWAWDMAGYSALIEGAGFKIVLHQTAGSAQVVLAERRR